MQYAKAPCCCWQHTPPTHPVFTEDPSLLKTPVTPPTHPVPTHKSAHTHRTSQNTITSLSLLVWKKVNHCETPQPPPPSSHPSGREGRQGLGAVTPLVRLGVVHFHRVEKFVPVEAAHSADDVAKHHYTGVATRRRHATQHLPLVAGRIVHLHTTQRVGAVEAANDKQLAWRKRETCWHQQDI